MIIYSFIHSLIYFQGPTGKILRRDDFGQTYFLLNVIGLLLKRRQEDGQAGMNKTTSVAFSLLKRKERNTTLQSYAR